MNQQEIRLTVLARIPDLNNSNEGARKKEKSSKVFLASGRLLGQATSCKLLAGLTLFMLVGAAIPFSVNKKPVCDNAGQAADAVASNQSPVASVPSNTVPPMVTPPERSAVLVPAVPERTVSPAVVPVSLMVRNDPSVNPDAATPLVSKWPPDDPGVASPNPAAGSGASPAMRPVEYQAERRYVLPK
jgi:hypothetical protein